MKTVVIKIVLLVCFTLVNCSRLFCQVDTCKMYLRIAENSIVRNAFHLQYHKDIPIVFIDTSGYFKCDRIGEIYDREVSVIHNSSKLDISEYSRIEVKSIKINKNRIQVGLSFNVRNSEGYVELRRRKNDFTVKKVSLGFY